MLLSRFAAFSDDADYSDLNDVLKVDRNEIHEIGHQLEDFVLKCTYDGAKCDKG